MTFKIMALWVAILSAVSACANGTVTATEGQASPPAASARAVDDDAAEKAIRGWAPRQQVAAHQMMAAYGMPQEATSEQLVWRHQGPFKRIVVTRVEDPHDFPMPHMDYIQHTIAYRVPVGKADALVGYDGSVTLDRTVGEMSARCDLEGHNILTLNLAHDIVTGKKTAAQARTAFGQIVVQDVKGEMPPYVMKLQFDPAAHDGADPDRPVIPGSPVRAAQPATPDAEVLGMVIAVNMNEILAAMEAQKKQVDAPVMEYARMLHKEHGKNAEATMMLGQKIGVTPAETPAVDRLRSKGAGELAALVPKKGDDFEKAYVDAMIKGHTEVLQMIDGQLMTSARNPGLKAHLTETRRHVEAHLQKAKDLGERSR